MLGSAGEFFFYITVLASRERVKQGGTGREGEKKGNADFEGFGRWEQYGLAELERVELLGCGEHT